MSDSVKVTLENRSVLGKNVKKLRRNGILPATVYGKGVGPFAVQLQLRAFQDLLRKVGRTRIVELTIPGQRPLAAFVHMLQRHPVTREIIHVDFRAVDLTIEVTVAVPFHMVGASPLVARGDALLNQSLSAIEISALPASLPSHIDVDISVLDSFDKSIHVRDLAVPAGSTFMTDGDELVAGLTMLRAEAEEAPVEEEAPAEPELVREKREEEEE